MSQQTNIREEELKNRAASSDETYNALLANLRAAHKTLASQIALKVYEYGFLKQ